MENRNPGLPVVSSLSFAHMVNDWYTNFLQVLLPFLAAAGFGVGRGAFLVSAFTLTSSVSQPLFGYWVDRYHQRWLVYVGTAWMAVLLGMVGWVHSYTALLALVAVAGFGTAAFHPQASAMVARAGGERKGFWLAVFIASGNVGWALTPVVVIPVVASYGLQATPLFLIPGLLAAGATLWASGRTSITAPGPGARKAMDFSGGQKNWSTMARIVAVVALRSWTYFSWVAFLPLFLQERGMPLTQAGRVLFLMLFAGAFGGIVGGAISDRYWRQDGRRHVLTGSLLVSSPLLMLFLAQPLAAWSLGLLAFSGIFLLASFSITVVLAQSALGGKAALASGLVLGFGVGIGGMGVGLMGFVAEHYGTDAVLHGLAWLPLVAAALAWTIRDPALRSVPLTNPR